MRSGSQWEADMPAYPSYLAWIQIFSFLSLLFLSCSGLSPTFLDDVQITHALRTACPLPGWPLSIFHCSICLALRFYSSSQILEFSNGLETSLKWVHSNFGLWGEARDPTFLKSTQGWRSVDHCLSGKDSGGPQVPWGWRLSLVICYLFLFSVIILLFLQPGAWKSAGEPRRQFSNKYTVNGWMNE